MYAWVCNSERGLSVLVTSTFYRAVQWVVFLGLTLVVALTISWALWAQVDFAYPWLHDHAGMAENIAYYGPRNAIRPAFEQTTTQERIRLFHGIVQAIQQHGVGLESMVYHDAQGKPINTLLTLPEIVHLQDVANLLDKLKQGALVALFGWVLMLVRLLQSRQVLPTPKQLLLGMTGLGVVVGLVLVLGAVQVFYQLHEWVFPAGHQWFFYYEQSLMSMMMQAPDLFGYIAVMLGVTALMITGGLGALYHRLVSKR